LSFSVFAELIEMRFKYKSSLHSLSTTENHLRTTIFWFKTRFSYLRRMKKLHSEPL